jgi:hypothetical protein
LEVKKLLVPPMMAGCGGDVQEKQVWEKGTQAEAKDNPNVPLMIPCEACKKEVSKAGEACANCSHSIAKSIGAYMPERNGVAVVRWISAPPES